MVENCVSSAACAALSLTPGLASWLRPRFISTSSFVLSRTLSSREPVRADEDSGAFTLPQTLNNSRARDIGVSVDLGRALRQLWGNNSGIGKVLARMRPVDFSNKLSRGSTFDLATFDPGLGFMLGLGGRDAFLSREGESARGASETRTTTISSGAELPFGFTTSISYSLTKSDRFQLVGDRFAETPTR